MPDNKVMLSVQPLEHVVAARGRCGTSAGRAALEALTDEGLAEVFAAEFRLEFPGRDKETARVLAAEAAKLDAAGERLAGVGLEPGETATALLALLGLAVADLNREGPPR